MPTRLVRALALGMLVIAGPGLAAVEWKSTTHLMIQTTDPPVILVEGTNANNARYFQSFELSAEQTSFTAEVRPRSGAEMHVTDVVRVDNSGGSQAYEIRFTATPVTNDRIEAFAWEVFDAGAKVGTVDYMTSQPEAGFTLAAGSTFTMDLHVDLADGAGPANAGIGFDLRLEVTA